MVAYQASYRLECDFLLKHQLALRSSQAAAFVCIPRKRSAAIVMVFAIIQRYKQAREARERELAVNPEDSSSGKKFRQLYKLGDRVSPWMSLSRIVCGHDR
jgi:hypothetical protein